MIEIDNLSKQYDKRTAVDGLNLAVEAGEIFGFVGPNGAGKTSTIRMIATLLKPTQGDIRVGGYSIHTAPREVRRTIGYMPDFFGVYSAMTVWEYLDFFGACYHIPEASRGVLIDDLMELVDLTGRRADVVDKLSRGLQQRLGLARTLIHDPQVLILDEPASGLDPRARVEIRELLVELARLGKTIFFSTHILADVAEICTRVGIIEAGRLVAVGTLNELQKNLVAQRQIHITVIDRVEEAQALALAVPGVSAVEIRPDSNHGVHAQLEIKFAGDDLALSSVLAALVSREIPVIHFSEDHHDLEEVFMRLTSSVPGS
ncbi:MAG TPA: ABC transporter ATP-binding protein [Anaerolineae bacterium]|nr:ABC transporter ATP-binding protein [Anaerolineae bacterium]